MTRCFLIKNVKSLVNSWEILEKEADVYAKNDNFDTANDTQFHADVLKRKTDFNRKIVPFG